MNGEEVRSKVEFTAEKTSGTVDMKFIFDATDIDGDLVVFERMYDADGKLLPATDVLQVYPDRRVYAFYGQMGAGKSVGNPVLRKTNLGKTAQKDAERGRPGMHGTLPFGKEYDDGDGYPEHLFPAGDSNPFHQGQL